MKQKRLTKRVVIPPIDRMEVLEGDTVVNKKVWAQLSCFPLPMSVFGSSCHVRCWTMSGHSVAVPALFQSPFLKGIKEKTKKQGHGKKNPMPGHTESTCTARRHRTWAISDCTGNFVVWVRNRSKTKKHCKNFIESCMHKRWWKRRRRGWPEQCPPQQETCAHILQRRPTLARRCWNVWLGITFMFWKNLLLPGTFVALGIDILLTSSSSSCSETVINCICRWKG